MIKATINNETKRNSFAKAGAKRIARSTCSLQPTFRGLVLNRYKVIASGTCTLRKMEQNRDNVILFAQKQKEVA